MTRSAATLDFIHGAFHGSWVWGELSDASDQARPVTISTNILWMRRSPVISG